MRRSELLLLTAIPKDLTRLVEAAYLALLVEILLSKQEDHIFAAELTTNIGGLTTMVLEDLDAF